MLNVTGNAAAYDGVIIWNGQRGHLISVRTDINSDNYSALGPVYRIELTMHFNGMPPNEVPPTPPKPEAETILGSIIRP